MKPKLLSILFTGVFFFLIFPASAQEETGSRNPPSWTSHLGYWVVETNKQRPKEAVVYYYTNAHILVYKEEIKNKKLKLNTATLHRLKQALEIAVASYANGRQAADDQALTLQR